MARNSRFHKNLPAQKIVETGNKNVEEKNKLCNASGPKAAFQTDFNFSILENAKKRQELIAILLHKRANSQGHLHVLSWDELQEDKEFRQGIDRRATNGWLNDWLI